MVGTAVETTLESMAATNIASIRPPVTRARWTVQGMEETAAGSSGDWLIAGKTTCQRWAKGPTAGNWPSRLCLCVRCEPAVDHGSSHASVADHRQVAEHSRLEPAEPVLHADRVGGAPGVGTACLGLSQRQPRVPPGTPP